MLALALVIALSFVGYKAPAAYAQGFNVSWDSSFQVLNLNPAGGADAGIDMYYYNQDGTLADMAPNPSGGTYANPDHDTIAAGSSQTYFPVHAADGFNGSVVISSNQPIAVISNLVINTPAKGGASYVAFQQGSTSVFFPLVMKGNSNQTTTFNVQNTGSNDVNFSVKFTPEAGSTYPAVTVPDVTGLKTGAAMTFDLNSMTQFASIAKWVGSVTVTATSSGGSLAGVATTVNFKDANAYQIASYNAFSGGSTTVVLPLIQENNNGNRTSINCQNLDAAQTVNITVSYTPNTKASETKQNVPPNGLAVFLQSYTGTTKFVGAATVTSDKGVNLVCVVNQQKPAKGSSSAYEGFKPTSATGTVVLPLIQSKNGKASSGWVYTSINLATADGANHPVKCIFNPPPGATAPADVTGADKAAYSFLQQDVFGNGTKFVGGATCTITDSSGVGLFGIVNQTRELYPESFRDVLSTYDGFNVQ